MTTLAPLQLYKCVPSEAWGCTLLPITCQGMGTLGNCVNASLTHEYFLSCTLSEQWLRGSIVKAENDWYLWWHHLWQILQPKTRFSFENFQGCMNSARRCQNQRSGNLLFDSFQFFSTEAVARNQPFCLSLGEIILGRCIGTRVNPSRRWRLSNVKYCEC